MAKSVILKIKMQLRIILAVFLGTVPLAGQAESTGVTWEWKQSHFSNRLIYR